MSRSTNALLLSALVFPGAGQLYLKRTMRGLLFIVPTLVAAAYFVNDLTERVAGLVDQAMSGALGTDPAVIAARLEQGAATPFLVNVAMYVMLACWIGAAVDAWLLGRKPAPPPHKP